MANGTELTELQMAILQVFWSRGEATTQNVHDALMSTRGLAPTTVATLLSRLERRGFLTHRRQGRQHVYRALVSRNQVRRSKLRELTDALFGGDPAALVSHLVGSEAVDPEELDRIRAMIDDAEAEEVVHAEAGGGGADRGGSEDP